MTTTQQRCIVEELLNSSVYAYELSPVSICYHFFGGKFRTSPEMIIDIWSYFSIHPDVYLSMMEKHIPNLLENEEIDLSLSIDRTIPNWQTNPLTLFCFSIYRVDFKTGANKTRTLLSEVWLDMPNSSAILVDNSAEEAKMTRWLSNPANLL